MLTNALEIASSLLFLSKFDSKIGLFNVECHKICYFYIKSIHRIQHWVSLHIYLVILARPSRLTFQQATLIVVCETMSHVHHFVTTYLCCKINSQACGLCKKRLIEHASRLFNIILYTHMHVHHLHD